MSCQPPRSQFFISPHSLDTCENSSGFNKTFCHFSSVLYILRIFFSISFTDMTKKCNILAFFPCPLPFRELELSYSPWQSISLPVDRFLYRSQIRCPEGYYHYAITLLTRDDVAPAHFDIRPVSGVLCSVRIAILSLIFHNRQELET